ncbi:MAG: large conductance mechanosensitive channel protein MscL [Candidatus Dormibacteraeota bacterium]|nr:large conductance mechanosensitive channel protein MscL [Candidatus Dormibacteraeota bacterium]
MKEFKAFLLRGNVVDLAVGVVIGAAFGAVVTSFVANIMMPPIGKLTGGIDFAALSISLGQGSNGKDVAIGYGAFINAVIAFLIVAAVVFFLVVKPMARLMPQPKLEADPETRECSECLTSIPVKARRCSACGQPQAVAA